MKSYYRSVRRFTEITGITEITTEITSNIILWGLKYMSTQISSIKFDYLKLQHVSSGFRCRDIMLTDEALLAETIEYDPSSFLRMFLLLLKELVFLFLFDLFLKFIDK